MIYHTAALYTPQLILTKKTSSHSTRKQKKSSHFVTSTLDDFRSPSYDTYVRIATFDAIHPSLHASRAAMGNKCCVCDTGFEESPVTRSTFDGLFVAGCFLFCRLETRWLKGKFQGYRKKHARIVGWFGTTQVSTYSTYIISLCCCCCCRLRGLLAHDEGTVVSELIREPSRSPLPCHVRWDGHRLLLRMKLCQHTLDLPYTCPIAYIPQRIQKVGISWKFFTTKINHM